MAPYWDGKAPLIVGCWHGRLLMIPEAWRRHGGGETYVLMGLNRNGELITRIVRRFRMRAIRGGSSKGGAAAREAMAAEVNANPNSTLSLTPDGPRGPRYVSKGGMAQVSRMLNIPVVWVTASAKWSVRFPTWDRFMFPLPFSKIRVEFAKPMFPAEYADVPLEDYMSALDAKGRSLLAQLDREVAGLSDEDARLLSQPQDAA